MRTPAGIPSPTPALNLDVIAFLTAGDMVLDDLAAQVGHSRAEVPWAALVRELDAAAMRGEHPPTLAPARRLDLLLRAARNRLVAHRTHWQYLAMQWQMDGSLQVILTGHIPEQATEMLRGVAATVGRPVPHGLGFEQLRDWLFGWAPRLGPDERRAVKQALRLAGYETYPPDQIVAEIIALTGTIA